MAVIMTEKTSVSKLVTQVPKPIRVAEIESELDLLWAQFNKNISRGQTVMRACMSNLIIYCDTIEEAEVISEEIPLIVDVHPARVLLLIGKGQPSDSTIDALIAVYYTPVDGGLQVCAERIDIISAPDAAVRLPSVARSQLIGDLPTTLWWASRQPPPETGELFFQLDELADQVIYDNVGWINPAKGVAAMTRWVSAKQDERVVFNLAWRRFAAWRKLISQVLDPLAMPGALPNIQIIEIDHGPHALSMVWLLVGWLASQLSWEPTDGKRLSNSELIWRFRSDGRDIKVIARRLPEGEPLIYRLLFDWNQHSKTEGQLRRTCFERLDNERIGISEVESNILSRVFTAQIPKRSTLVSGQMAQRFRDKVFENSMKVSNKMTAFFQN